MLLDTNDKDEIFDALISQTVFIKFTKADGSERVMNASLNEALINSINTDLGNPLFEFDLDTLNESRNNSPKIQTVFDLDIGEWRTFAWERLHEAEVKG